MPQWRNNSIPNICHCGNEREIVGVTWSWKDYRDGQVGTCRVEDNYSRACFRCNSWLHTDCRDCSCNDRENKKCNVIYRPDTPFLHYQMNDVTQGNIGQDPECEIVT